MTVRLSRIAVLLALVLVLTAVGSAVATYVVAKHEFRAVLDHDLRKQSKLLLGLIRKGQLSPADPDFNGLIEKVFRSQDEEAIWVNIYDTDAEQHVSNFANDIALGQSDNGKIELELDGNRWYGYQRADGPIVVQLLRSDDHLAAVQDEILEDIQTPLMITGGLNLLILFALIGMTLWPLIRLGREIEERSPESLAPLTVRSPAHEVMVFRQALNRLMSDVNDALGRERQFANDAAHELRTPLTTLKLELSGDQPDLGVVKSEIDRLADLIDQLLTLARVDQGHWRRNFKPVDLEALCSTELERLEPGLVDCGITLETRLGHAQVRGDEVLLAVLLQNLVANVLRHCGSGSRLCIDLATREGAATLRIADDGPGIDPTRLENLNAGSARFDSRGEGLGLGLSICRKITDLHGATLTFSPSRDSESGLTVEIRFPA